MLRATRASTFSTSQLQKVLRTWCVLYILTRALKLSSFLKAEGNSLAGFARLHCQPKQSRRCMKMSQSHCLSSSLETKAHPPQQNTALYQQESEQGRPRYFPAAIFGVIQAPNNRRRRLFDSYFSTKKRVIEYGFV